MILPFKSSAFPAKRFGSSSPKSLLRIGHAPPSSTVKSQGGTAFVKEFTSGKRRYICKSFQFACNGHDSPQPAFAVLLERDTANIHSALADISAQFGLTQREGETVEFLLQGLTSKEIGTRMNISANTVKAFLRLVMVKMKVSTRSGIAGKIAGSRAGCSPVILQPIKPIEAGVENHRREYLEMR